MRGRSSSEPSVLADHGREAPFLSKRTPEPRVSPWEERAELPKSIAEETPPPEATTRETTLLRSYDFNSPPKPFDPASTDFVDYEVVRSARETPPLPQHSARANTLVQSSWDDPLGDVLDWLGRSDLGKDDRFLPPDDSAPGYFPDDLDIMMDPDAAFPGHAREWFPESVGNGAHARAQAPRSRPVKQATQHLSTSSSCSNLSQQCVPGVMNQRDLVSEEEQEWVSRQQRTGTVGRLVIYSEGDLPQEDVLLRGGTDRHLVVAAIRDSGPAAKAGVKAGDRLVSIDGRKDFMGMSADAVRDHLKAPTMLVFLGFVGKLQAEVRLTCSDRVCGLSSRHEVARGYSDAPVQVCEERVFNAGIASLFLAVENEKGGKVRRQLSRSPWNPHIPMFELQRLEAYDIVRGALNKVSQPEVSQPEEISHSDEAGQWDNGNAARPDVNLGTVQKPGGDFGQVEDEQLAPTIDEIDTYHSSVEKPVLKERLQGLFAHQAQQELQEDMLQWEMQHDLQIPQGQELAELLLNSEPEPEDFLLEQTF